MEAEMERTEVGQKEPGKSGSRGQEEDGEKRIVGLLSL